MATPRKPLKKAPKKFPVYWACMDCDAHGETTGTESGADVKHVREHAHSTVTSMHSLLFVSLRKEDS